MKKLLSVLAVLFVSLAALDVSAQTIAGLDGLPIIPADTCWSPSTSNPSAGSITMTCMSGANAYYGWIIPLTGATGAHTVSVNVFSVGGNNTFGCFAVTATSTGHVTNTPTVVWAAGYPSNVQATLSLGAITVPSGGTAVVQCQAGNQYYGQMVYSVTY